MASFLSFPDGVQRYTCEKNPDANALSTIPNGYSYTPFVELRMGDEIVTVGNRSRPEKGNSAVIKSLEYGMSDGVGAKIEIYDEEGGNFTKFFDSLNKSIQNGERESLEFELDFGWIIERKCGSETFVQKIAASNSGTTCNQKINLIAPKMNVSYEGGKIKYQLEATDNMIRVNEARVECNIGTDDKKVPLKQAIRKLFKELRGGPTCDVQFKSSDGDKEFSFKKEEGGYDGPTGVWNTNQQNKLATVRRWIEPYTTSNGKGIILQWKGCGSPTIIFMEDPGPTNCEEPDPCKTNISRTTGRPGTYVVNGGPTSSVISFSPSVNWNYTMQGKIGGTQSSVDGGGSKAGTKKSSCGKDDNTEQAGATTSARGNFTNNKSVENSTDSNQSSAAEHQRANRIREAMGPIEAELRIFGDPSLSIPEVTTGNGNTLSLIVINPFHIKGGSEFKCGDWLASPVVNPVFSNKSWRISGVNHQINSGSYVTILKISLAGPGIELPSQEGERLGGANSEGYLPISNIVNNSAQENRSCEPTG